MTLYKVVIGRPYFNRKSPQEVTKLLYGEGFGVNWLDNKEKGSVLIMVPFIMLLLVLVLLMCEYFSLSPV